MNSSPWRSFTSVYHTLVSPPFMIWWWREWSQVLCCTQTTQRWANALLANMARQHTNLLVLFVSQTIQWLLQFSSWVALFSLSLLFIPRLLSWGPFLMLTITIFLSWDPLCSPYVPSNPYTIPCITTRQRISFCLLLLSHGHLLLQLILSYRLHTPLTHSLFYDIPWHSIHSYSVEHST